MGPLTLDELRTMTKEYRLQRNLTGRAFARIVGISPSSLSRFETGERTLVQASLKKLCDYLGAKYDAAKLKMTVTCPTCYRRFVPER